MHRRGGPWPSNGPSSSLLGAGMAGALLTGPFRNSPGGWLVYTAAVALAVVGTLSRWGWLYWALAALFLLYTVGVAFDLVQLMQPASSSTPEPTGAIATLLHDSLHAVVGAAMVVLGFAVGSWGCRAQSRA